MTKDAEGKEIVEEDKGSKEKEVESKVVLDAEQYNALLDRMAELEAGSIKRSRRSDEVIDVDELADEGRSRREPERRVREEEEEIDWDNLSNKQLVEVVLNRVGAQLNEEAAPRLQKVEVAVETLRVLREIDKAEKDHEDFWEYEKEVRSISTANPTLSIEEAYELAKVRKGKAKSSKEGDGKETTQTERLLKLPPRIVSGEKPNKMVTSATKKSSTHVTLREATNEAWDEVVGKGKTDI